MGSLRDYAYDESAEEETSRLAPLEGNEFMPTKKKSSTGATTKNKADRKKTRAVAKKRISFIYDAPGAKEVSVTGSFCRWDEGIAMKRDGDGCFKAVLTLPRGDYEYRFRVDGEWRNDPNCSETTPNRYGSENCVVHV